MILQGYHICFFSYHHPCDNRGACLRRDSDNTFTATIKMIFVFVFHSQQQFDTFLHNHTQYIIG